MDNRIALVRKAAFQDGAAQGSKELAEIILEKLRDRRYQFKNEEDYLEFYFDIKDLV